TPAEILESSFPLYHLFPDPNIPNHSAKGKNIYFGVVPATSLDTDATGRARFDDEDTYEIRCFVRRRRLDCPRTGETPDCAGQLVWSERTEIYRLATPTDLIGTSNMPVTIKMPDFRELAAQAVALPVNKLASVRVIQPQSMNFNVEDGKATGGGLGGFQICFFSIPLITIVAMFVFKLFLMVVVFLFGLFFLLRLKFCIPPSLSIDAGLFTKLSKLKAGLDFNANLNIDADFVTNAGVAFNAESLNSELQTGINLEHGITKQEDKDQLDAFSNKALLPLGDNLREAKKLTGTDNRPLANAGLDLTGSLEFEPRVEAQPA
ncbi:MAG: hypothetical protein ACKV2V_19755, partial [Blastocatellia bacterium]